ncbi:hypothetical protein Taro_037785, partial [Colocasia esculenta]|nr:hypothetical protein [Colocasia esculenta]
SAYSSLQPPETMAASANTGRTVVLYPSPGMGHLVPLVALATVLARRGLAVTVATVVPPYDTGSVAAFLDRASADVPGVSFHRLPAVTLPTLDTSNQMELGFQLIRLSDPNLLRYLQAASPTALVLDFLCATTMDVAAEVGVPVFLFFTSGAGALTGALYTPVLHDIYTENFRDMGDTRVLIPGSYAAFIYLTKRLTEADVLIVNTFEELEPTAIKAIRDGLCAPPGTRTPPVYCVGPLITPENRVEKDPRETCLAWLDSQPRASVVFLCFGSLGRFSAEQLKEMATGLEKSRQRFLWVVRSPPSDDPSKRFEKPPEPDLDALLPVGFRERTRERGMVVNSWAPQASVLAHESVGGFVTHMGWNSVLEAICAGVPIWMNKVLVVDDLGLAGVVEGYDKGTVTAAEVEGRIRWLMESEEGKALTARTSSAREAAMAAQRAGGSSYKSLEDLASAVRRIPSPVGGPHPR